MKTNDLIDIIGEAADEHILDAKTPQKKTNRWVRWVATAACLCLIGCVAWDTMDRLDYNFFAAGCGAWPGQIVNGDYYYYVQHKGVMKYTPEGESDHLLHTYWFEEWDVNEYGIYYWYDMSVYVRDHKTGARTKLYTASRSDCTHIRFVLTGDGNVIVTHYNKDDEFAYELLLDGVTGELLETVMEPISYDEAKYTYYSDTHFIIGDRHIVLEPVDEQKNLFMVTENGQSILPDGILVGKWPDHFGGTLWFSVREQDAEIDRYAVVHPNGRTEIVTLPSDYYYGGTTEYLFAPENNSRVRCVEVATGDFWVLEADAEGDFHDLATDGVYLYTTAPWDHVQTCWKIIVDDTGKPMGLTLIEQDITPE